MDDRGSFRADVLSASVDGGPVGAATSSDWLSAGETARAGKIDSVSTENSGLSTLGPTVVDDGDFQTRLLCPSQV